ncbi:hypothetical protein KUCAC02_006673, partial [Chaenocephalus aceratus]
NQLLSRGADSCRHHLLLLPCHLCLAPLPPDLLPVGRGESEGSQGGGASAPGPTPWGSHYSAVGLSHTHVH